MEHEYKLVVNEMGVCVTATVDDTQYRPIDMCTETITPPQSHVLNDIVTVVGIHLNNETEHFFHSVSSIYMKWAT